MEMNSTISPDKLCPVGSVFGHRSRGRKLESQLGYITLVAIDTKSFLVILSLSPIQEGQLSVTGKKKCTSTG